MRDDGRVASENLSRRQFVKGAAVAPAIAQEWLNRAGKESKRRLLFVGTQTVKGSSSRGIYSYRWDPDKGRLDNQLLAAESDNPSFITVDPQARFLYAANEIDEFEGQKSGAVSSFEIDHTGAKLKPVNKMRSLGPGTCMVATDHLGRNLFCANYTGGSATSFYLNSDGQISDPVSHFQYEGHGPNPERQEAPHAHRVTVSPKNDYLLVNDLGLDCIHIYHLDSRNAKCTPSDPAQWKSGPGAGPRALQFHPNGHVAYCVCEMASEVDVLRWNEDKGTLETMQKLPMLPEGYHGPTRGDDIVIDRAAKFAYATNRDNDFLVTFRVEGDGKLQMLNRGSCGGKIPRHLALDPTEKWLLIANEQSDVITVFERNPETGKVAEKGTDYPLAKPQCLVFA
jgi:6-phosphogluconolactonase